LLAVANQAQGSDVVEVALSAAFRDRQNVIGVPQRPRLVHVQFVTSPGLPAPVTTVFSTRGFGGAS
jgi:hypothetical protein